MTENPLRQDREQPAEILCGSCGRFVGAQTRCSHCGASVDARLSVTLFRVAAVVLSTFGLGLLYWMAVHRDIPLLEIGSISPTLNFAYVRVAGVVSSDGRVSREAGRVRSVRFSVEDGTGEITVVAYGAKGQALAERSLVPRAGDRVEVTGSLNVSAERVALWLQSPDEITLVRPEARLVKLGDITVGMRGESVAIAGRVTEVTAPPDGTKRPWTVEVEDGSARKQIVFWPDVDAELQNRELLRPGTGVRARVTVSTYRGEVQLRLENAREIELTPSGAAPGGELP